LNTADERTSETPDEAWTVARLLRWATEDLTKRGSDSPRLDAELLLGRTLGLDRVQLIVQHTRPLADEELAAFKRLFVRRRAREPIAYILGGREFYGFEVQVDRRVLVPRPDTEVLVDVALARTGARDMYGRALDLCTGSGCVAFALGLRRRTWKITGVDLSEDALVVARANAIRLGVARNVHFMHGDLFQSLRHGQRFELIVSNPPYIPSGEIPELMPEVRDFEPRLALDGGTDGYRVLQRLVAEAPAHLTPGGVLACELGAGQSDHVVELFEAAGFADVRRNEDLGGHERVVSGQLPG
jgi:release factor glutamine methyltransferase